jgi:hypothetical protein
VEPPLAIPLAKVAVVPPTRLAVPVPTAGVGDVVPPGTVVADPPLKFHWVMVVCVQAMLAKSKHVLDSNSVVLKRVKIFFMRNYDLLVYNVM